MEKPLAKKATPCAAPVRSSGTVSAITFCRPMRMSPVESACRLWTTKKPGTPSPSGQISGKAIQRTIAATPAMPSTAVAETEPKTPREHQEHADFGDHGKGPEQADERVSLIPIDFQ